MCLAPLLVIDRLREFDVEVQRETGEARALTALCAAVRLALSRALIQLVDARDVNALRLGYILLKLKKYFDYPKYFIAGYLTFDPRVRERYKPGQKGARGKWIWYAFRFFCPTP